MFQHNIYSTWKDFNTNFTSTHQIDHIITNHHGLKKATDCKVTSLGVASDHSGLLTSLVIKEPQQYHKKIKRTTKWELLTQESFKLEYNQALSNHLNPEGDMDDFCNAMSAAGKEVLTREESTDPG